MPFTPQEKIALVGPGPNHKIFGAWSWQEKERRSHFPRGLGPKLTTNLLVAQEPFDYFEPTAAAIEEALTLASQADKVVVALGETDWMSGEAASRSDIRLPENN